MNSVTNQAEINRRFNHSSNDARQSAIQHVTLTIAQNNLPGYQTKATTASADAQTAATASSAGASKATNGNIGDAKSARNDADDAYDKAKDSRAANNNVGRQAEKIRKLKARLYKKEQRLKDLNVMRTAIYAQIPSNH